MPFAEQSNRHSSREARHRSVCVVAPLSRFDWVLVVVILCVSAWGIWQAQRLMRSDFSAMGARYQVDTWMSGQAQWTVPEWIEARDNLQGALETTPDNPLVYDYLGVLNTLRGQNAWRVPSLRKLYFGDALVFQKESVRLRWHNGAAWANLALTHYALDDHAAAVTALQHALEYGPNELHVKQLSAELILAMWPEVQASQQAWLLKTYRSAKPFEQKVIEQLALRYGVVQELKN